MATKIKPSNLDFTTLNIAVSNTGNVGIGLTPSTSDPLTDVSAGLLQVNGNVELRYLGTNVDPAGARYFNIVNTDTTLVADQPLGGIQWVGLDTDNPNSNMASITSYCSGNAGTTGDLRFKIAGTERARIDSSGNLLVGTTSTPSTLTTTSSVVGVGIDPGYVAISRASTGLFVNRITTDGEIIGLRKNGTTVGSLGTTTSAFWIASPTENRGVKLVSDDLRPTLGAGVDSDNSMDLGDLTVRWDDVYATNGTIQTSDRNEKQDIEELSEAERRVAVACKGLLRKYRWKDAVAEKGDEARTHFGIIAQDLQDAFVAEGLDAGRYAMFIHSTWTDEETGEERSRMGVRYSELLAFMIAAL